MSEAPTPSRARPAIRLYAESMSESSLAPHLASVSPTTRVRIGLRAVAALWSSVAGVWVASALSPLPGVAYLWILGVVLLFVYAALVPDGKRSQHWLPVLGLTALVALGIASIGIFFVPPLALLVVAEAVPRRRTR